MMFERSILEEMFSMVSKEKPFWMVFLEEVDVCYRNSGSGASEYELYFNYVAQFHHDKIVIRGLQWENVGTLDFQKYSHLNYISVSSLYEIKSRIIKELSVFVFGTLVYIRTVL
jgi:hypothetical protein